MSTSTSEVALDYVCAYVSACACHVYADNAYVEGVNVGVENMMGMRMRMLTIMRMMHTMIKLLTTPIIITMARMPAIVMTMGMPTSVAQIMIKCDTSDHDNYNVTEAGTDNGFDNDTDHKYCTDVERLWLPMWLLKDSRVDHARVLSD